MSRMKNSEQQTLCMLEKGKNWAESSSSSASHGRQAIGMVNGVPSDHDQQKKNPKSRYDHQTNTLEAFYKECSYPDISERRLLGEKLGIAPTKVKFWFQNKHSREKRQQEHMELVGSQIENQELRSENIKLKQAFGIRSCQICGGQINENNSTVDLLRIENQKIKEVIYWLNKFLNQLNRKFNIKSSHLQR